MQRPVLVAAFAATFLVACPPPPTPQCIGLCQLDAQATASDQFTSPFDATLSPDGKIAYFTAMTPDGASGIFSSTVGSADAPTMMTSGDPLVAPLSLDVTSDGSKLYISD